MTTKVDDLMKEKILCQSRFAEEVEKIVKAKGINKLLFLFHQFMVMKQVEKIMKASRPQNP